MRNSNDHMRPVEEFLKDYFGARTQHYRVLSAKWAQFMTQYMTPGYKPFSSAELVEQSEAEEIVAVHSSEGEAEVITSGLLVANGWSWRGRYQLAATGDSWQIARIEVECVFCKGTGKANERDCELCKGNGWSLVGVP